MRFEMATVQDLAREPLEGILFDLLMAVMDSVEIWSSAAGDPRRGLAWRDAVTARMAEAGSYRRYEDLVVRASREIGLSRGAAGRLFALWGHIAPRPDAAVVSRLGMPYAFVTNCSAGLAAVAVDRSGLRPLFTLAAETAGCYKPDARIYRRACRMLGTRPARTLFVAGSPYDAAGARRAGLPAVFVARRNDQQAPEGIPVAGSLEDLVDALGGTSRF